jgi:hypothetical protein
MLKLLHLDSKIFIDLTGRLSSISVSEKDTLGRFEYFNEFLLPLSAPLGVDINEEPVKDASSSAVGSKQEPIKGDSSPLKKYVDYYTSKSSSLEDLRFLISSTLVDYMDKYVKTNLSGSFTSAHFRFRVFVIVDRASSESDTIMVKDAKTLAFLTRLKFLYSLPVNYALNFSDINTEEIKDNVFLKNTLNSLLLLYSSLQTKRFKISSSSSKSTVNAKPISVSSSSSSEPNPSTDAVETTDKERAKQRRAARNKENIEFSASLDSFFSSLIDSIDCLAACSFRGPVNLIYVNKNWDPDFYLVKNPDSDSYDMGYTLLINFSLEAWKTSFVKKEKPLSEESKAGKGSYNDLSDSEKNTVNPEMLDPVDAPQTSDSNNESSVDKPSIEGSKANSTKDLTKNDNQANGIEENSL